MCGIMENNSRESGKTEKRMDMVFGNPRKEISTKANGRTTGNTERDIMFTQVDPNTAVTSKTSSRAARVRKNLPTEINTQACTNKANHMAMEDTFGQMAIHMRANSSMALVRVKELCAQQAVKYMKASSKMT